MENKFDFVRNSLENGKEYVAEVGFMKVKIDKLLLRLPCSKTKFYNYFGGLNAYLLLMITDEWGKMVPFIQSNLKYGLLDNQCIESILSLRLEFISENKLISMFCNQQSVFTKRLKPLRDEIIRKENEILADLFRDCKANIKTVDNTLFDELWAVYYSFPKRNDFILK